MEEDSKFTPYDEILQTKELQMLKTIIPYVNKPARRQLSFIIQYMSMLNSMKVLSEEPALSIAENENPTDKTRSLLSELKKYCTPKEQDTIENILNIITLLDSKEIYDQAGIFK